MAPAWRVIDTGTRRAAENFALNRALLEARKRRMAPSTLRFLRFGPSALLGYHQSAEQELDLDYCRANGIEVQRRITGGGAIYMGTWEPSRSASAKRRRVRCRRSASERRTGR
jgi:lipoate-protein ligase A